jgi:hypothetical protein
MLLLASLPTAASRGEPAEPPSIAVFCEDQVDLNFYRGKPVENINLWKSNVRDLSPLAGMPVKTLVIFGCPVKDLSPLAGMPLESAWIGATEARDFSPLKGAPLRDLNLSTSAVSDLSFVRKMPLRFLKLSSTGEGRINDLSLLEGMRLEELEFEASTVTRGMDLLRGMKSLKKINGQNPEKFWRRYAAEAPVRDRLRKSGVSFHWLRIAENGSLSLGFHGPEIEDLAALKGFHVDHLSLGGSVIRDFSTLKELKTTRLLLGSDILEDLSSLRGTSLKMLSIGCPKVEDIAPLKGLALQELYIDCPKVTDLSALQGMPLTMLNISRSGARDLTPLAATPLEFIILDMDRRPNNMEILRGMKSLKQINYHEVGEFWEAYDAGRFDDIQLPTWMFGWK